MSNKQINPLKILEKTKKQLFTTVTPKTKPIQKSTLFLESLANNKQPLNNKQVTLKQNKPKNYKTKMCPQGRQCRRQFTCTFAHNEHQLRKPFMKRTKICVMYQHGKCSLGSVCRQYHGNLDLKKNYQYKKQLCQQFLQNGTCNKGKLCIYKHGQHDNGVLDEESQMMQQKEQQIQIVNKQSVNEAQYYKVLTKQQQKQAKQLSYLKVSQEKENPSKNQIKQNKTQIEKLESAKPLIQEQIIVFSFE